MCSVFSNMLALLGHCDVKKPSEVYNQLRIAYNQGVEGILDNATVFITSKNDDEVDYDVLYEIWRNESLKDLLHWVNKKITLQLGISDYRTMGVRLRIATGMLNKLINEGKITLKLGIRIHENFVTTINDEFSAISTEDLPF